MSLSVPPTGAAAAGREGVTIVVPAFNEVNGIAPSLDRLLATLGATTRPVEIIVVDDGSTDGTSDALAKYPVKLIRHPVNRGYGAALKTGIRQAKHDIIAITDADGTYPNERLMSFVDLLVERDLDMVVGARTGANVQIPLIRRPAKAVLRGLASYAASRSIPDINSGMRVFRRSLAERFLGMLPNGFSFTTTITLAALTNDFLVEYVPIDYIRREGRSKIHPIRDTLGFAGLTTRMALYFAPLKVFIPLAFMVLLTALGVALYTLYVVGRLADVTTVILVITAFHTAMLGLIAELINKRLVSHKRST